jgi:hypothetical protein
MSSESTALTGRSGGPAPRKSARNIPAFVAIPQGLGQFFEPCKLGLAETDLQDVLADQEAPIFSPILRFLFPAT